MLTGIKDLDREILFYISDEELLKIWIINKYFYYKVCDDAFLKRRLTKYKVSKIEPGKKFFADAIYCIPRLKLLGFEYTFGNIKKQYILLKEYRCCPYRTIVEAAKEGEIAVLIYFFNKGKILTLNNCENLRRASESGHLETVKYLVKIGSDIHVYGDFPLRIACKNGHFELVKYLVENKANVRAYDGQALRWAKEYKHFQIVEFLENL